MPLAAVARDPRISRVAVRLTMLVAGITMLGYVPHGSGLGL